MKINYLIISIIIFSSCSSNDPKTLAKEYCECVKNNIETPDIQQCAEMAKEHREILSDEPDKLQKYSDELVNCTNVSL